MYIYTHTHTPHLYRKHRDDGVRKKHHLSRSLYSLSLSTLSLSLLSRISLSHTHTPTHTHTHTHTHMQLAFTLSLAFSLRVCLRKCWRMLTYADVCVCVCYAYADVCDACLAFPLRVCLRKCWRTLTYADVCYAYAMRMLTYATHASLFLCECVYANGVTCFQLSKVE